MESQSLESILESMLFFSGEPVKIAKIAKLLEKEEQEIDNALNALSQRYDQQKSGLMLLRKKDEAQLASRSENSEYVEKMVKSDLEGPLSQAALEVLSIIAYKGPISKPEIESIRGVNCSYTLRNLSLRGLIQRENNPKDSRGYLYSITFDFLKKLGIESVEKLPDYGTLSVDERINSVIVQE